MVAGGSASRGVDLVLAGTRSRVAADETRVRRQATGSPREIPKEHAMSLKNSARTVVWLVAFLVAVSACTTSGDTDQEQQRAPITQVSEADEDENEPGENEREGRENEREPGDRASQKHERDEHENEADENERAGDRENDGENEQDEVEGDEDENENEADENED